MIAIIAAAFAWSENASALPIAGCLSYDAATSTGFRDGSDDFHRITITPSGVAFGTAVKSAPGQSNFSKPVRWTAVGAGAELASPQVTGYVMASNARGVAVGIGDTRALRWESGSTGFVELDPLEINSRGTTSARALGINGSGLTVGSANWHAQPGDGGGAKAVRWADGGTTPVALDALSPDGLGYVSEAVAVNDSGVIVGTSERKNASGAFLNGGRRAARWAAGGISVVELQGLGLLNNRTDNAASAVNAAGTTVGFANKVVNNVSVGTRPVRWDADSVTAVELGTLGTDATGFTVGSAPRINDRGQIAGYTAKYVNGVNMGFRAVRWEAGSTIPIELGNLGTSSAGYAQAFSASINSSGVVVGRAEKYVNGTSTGFHAALWTATAQAIDLNDLGLSDVEMPAGTWLLTSASAVADTGFVAGIGNFDPDGPGGSKAPYARSFAMLVPEAGTYGLGDANFDTHVGFSDLVILAQHYGLSNLSHDTHVADFDLDGVTDFNDLVTLSQHYAGDASAAMGFGDADFAADWALAQSLVPEPVNLGAIAAMMLVTRRRSR